MSQLSERLSALNNCFLYTAGNAVKPVPSCKQVVPSWFCSVVRLASFSPQHAVVQVGRASGLNKHLDNVQAMDGQLCAVPPSRRGRPSRWLMPAVLVPASLVEQRPTIWMRFTGGWMSNASFA